MILWKLLLENLNIVRFSVSLNEDSLIQGSQFYSAMSQSTGKEIIIGEVNVPQSVIWCTSQPAALNSLHSLTQSLKSLRQDNIRSVAVTGIFQGRNIFPPCCSQLSPVLHSRHFFPHSVFSRLAIHSPICSLSI